MQINRTYQTDNPIISNLQIIKNFVLCLSYCYFIVLISEDNESADSNKKINNSFNYFGICFQNYNLVEDA